MLTHQQGLGSLFKNLIGSVFARRSFGGRNRYAASDLPASLRQDIGLGPEPAADSFEGKWQQELRCLRR